ncbi:MAG: DUF4340 domain-containing protein, partial [Candidatus Eisenbacteria bacterium]|nr:DUF4340 domain-containing protein [Candidatus Eisenbacteria bacterium]
MRLPRIWIQILLAAGILLLWLYISRQPGRDHPGPSPFEGWEADTVSAIVWTSAGATRSVKRDASGWIYHAGRDSRPRWRRDEGNERLILELLHSLERFRAERVLDLEDDPAVFGLAPAQARMVLRADEDRADTLWIGAPAPVEGGRYATWSDLRRRVAVLDDYIAQQYVLVDDDRLRDPRLARLELGDVDTVFVAADTAGFRLIRRGRQWWMTADGRTYRADTLACQKATGTLLRAQAIRFMEAMAEPEPADLGLAPPGARWILSRAGRRDTFRIGSHLAEEGRLLIQTPGRPPAVTLDDDWSLLQGDPGLFRDRLVLGGDPATWRRLELYRGRRRLTRLERTPEGWARPSAAPLLGGPGPQERFTAAVENLAHLRFAEFGAAPSRPPDLRLRLEGSG